MTTKTTLIWSVIIALIIGWAVGHYAGTSPSVSDDKSENSAYSSTSGMPAVNSDKQISLYTTMRKLWTDHMWWTRSYIVDAVNGSAAASADATRLMKNQEDIGNAVATYYGKDAGNQLTALLKE